MQINELQLSHSSLQSFHSCERKLEFRKFYFNSRRDDSHAGDAGNAIHAGYEHFLVTGDVDASIAVFMFEYPIRYQTTPWANRSIQACLACLLALMDFEDLYRYELAQINTESGIKPAIEVPFRINIKDFSLSDTKTIPVYYVGYIDIILYDKLDDSYIVVDLKSTARNMNDMTAQYQFDPQCLPYSMVIERCMGAKLDSLNVKYLSAKISLMEPKIRMYPFVKTKQDIEEWVQNLMLDLHMIKTYYNSGWFPRRGGFACTAWNKQCVYFDYCTSRDATYIENMLEFNNDKEEPRPFEPWVTMDLEFTDDQEPATVHTA